MIAANTNPGRTATAPRQQEEPEMTVWITVAAALIIGFFLMFFVTNQTTTVTAGGTTLKYPSTWRVDTTPGSEFAAADTVNGGTFGDRVSVHIVDKTELLPGKTQTSLQDAAANWSTTRQTALVGYRVLAVNSVKVGDKDGIQVEGAYLMDSPYGTSALPALMHSYDTLALSGDKFYVLSFATAQSDVERGKGVNDKLVSSWRLP